MKYASFFIVLFLVFSTAQAQEITAFPGFWNVEYYQDDRQITKKELKVLMTKNDEVNAYWKKSTKNATIGYVAFAGQMASVVWLASELSSEGDNETLTPAVATVGFGIIAGIFLNAANKNGKTAILTYNKQFDNKTTYRLVPVSNQNGLGLALQF
jgi:hypothetical protein